MTARQSAAEIDREAAGWVLRLDRDGSDSDVLAQLDAWLAGDVRRRGALLQAEATWLVLDVVGTQSDDVPGSADVASDEIGTRGRLLSRRSMIVGLTSAIAASVAGVYLVGTHGEMYQTTIGEVRRVPLADRSTMAINTGSRIAVTYVDTRRAVSIEQGEAWFQVTKDKTRPFVVSAGPVRVEAVGTAFSVRRRDEGADIMVTEGIVRVWVEGDEARAVQLDAGSALFISNTASIRPESAVAPMIERKLAWRSGQLNLAGETLGEAVEEFNRYSPTPIIIPDRAVADRRLYGVFRLDDPQSFARTAAITLGVAAWPEADRIVIAASHNEQSKK